VVGGAGVGALGILLALVPGVDLTPLFPRALPAPGGFSWQAGSWFDATHGVLVGATGDLTWVATSATGAGAPAGASPLRATFCALGVSALGLPLWATTPEAIGRRAAVAFTVASAAVLVFHLVAAGRISPMSLLLPPLLLLADTIALHRSAAWS
jgi:hypothetical protein